MELILQKLRSKIGQVTADLLQFIFSCVCVCEVFSYYSTINISFNNVSFQKTFYLNIFLRCKYFWVTFIKFPEDDFNFYSVNFWATRFSVIINDFIIFIITVFLTKDAMFSYLMLQILSWTVFSFSIHYSLLISLKYQKFECNSTLQYIDMYISLWKNCNIILPLSINFKTIHNFC